MHKKEKDSSQFNLTAIENTKMSISNTREYFRSAGNGDQPLGEEMKFLRQDDKEYSEGSDLQYSLDRDGETGASFSCKNSHLMMPSKIEKIHSSDISHSLPRHFDSSSSEGIEMALHWIQVPVTDTDEDNTHLPACLYSEKGNAAQVSLPDFFLLFVHLY